MLEAPSNSDIENYRSLLANLATLVGEKTRLGLSPYTTELRT